MWSVPLRHQRAGYIPRGKLFRMSLFLTVASNELRLSKLGIMGTSGQFVKKRHVVRIIAKEIYAVLLNKKVAEDVIVSKPEDRHHRCSQGASMGAQEDTTRCFV